MEGTEEKPMDDILKYRLLLNKIISTREVSTNGYFLAVTASASHRLPTEEEQV